MGQAVQLRRFRNNDLRGVYELARTTLRENYNPTLFVELSPYWPDGFMVLEDQGEIIGFIFGIMVSPVESRVLMLAVSPLYRRRSLGTLLCQQFVKESANRGIHLVSLEVRASNLDALHFYEKMGFEMVGRIKEYYTDKEDGLKLQKYL